MLQAHILRIDRDLTPSEYRIMMKKVPPEKQAKIDHFCFLKDAQRSMLGVIMATHAVNEHLGLPGKPLMFGTNHYGKPYLLEYPGLHFNISHSGGYVCCALSMQPVGIDVEEITCAEMQIAERFFSIEEYGYLKSFPHEERNHAFFEVWTKKESYIKQRGKGLSIPLTSFSVLDMPDMHFCEVVNDGVAICNICIERSVGPVVVERNEYAVSQIVHSVLF